jgi:hypothetical protein
VVSFTPWPLYSQRKSPFIHWREGCVGSSGGLDAEEKRKIHAFTGNLTLGVQTVT